MQEGRAMTRTSAAVWLALLACGCDTIPPSDAFSPWPAPCHGGPQQSGRWGDCAGEAGRRAAPPLPGTDGRGQRTVLRLGPGRGADAGRVGGLSLNSIAAPVDVQIGLEPATSKASIKTEEDYGTLFRGTETLFRFCARNTKEDSVVSAGRFKEGGCVSSRGAPGRATSLQCTRRCTGCSQASVIDDESLVLCAAG